jgi:aspartyl-tRNA(Asn)/glutamyl-tRNA(Gln) amidotransferase subunit A
MDLNKLTISETLEGFKKNDFSSEEVTKDCLAKISQSNKQLNSFITVFEAQAIASAKIADQKIKKGEKLPLLGIPFAIKDNFLTKGRRTTAASKVLDDYIPQYNSTVVQKLEDAGAVILGKTNLDAWCHGSSTETSDYGSCKNPHNINTLPGGSSGGSAAAISSHQTIGSIGSETAGSIRQPASWCGVVGLKPTYGRVSRYGVIAMGSSLDSPGPLTKTAKDAARILEVIAGQDKFDGTTSPQKVTDYTKNLSTNIKGMTIGIPKEYFMNDSQKGINQLVLDAAKQMEKMGAKLKEISMMDPKYSIAVYTIVQRSEVSSNLGRFDGIRYGKDRSYMGAEAKRRIMLGTYALSSGYYDAYYQKAQKVRTLLKRDFQKVFSSVDAVLAPTSPSVALPIGSSFDHPMFGEISDVLVEASSMAGLTGINVPCGLINNLPVGMQFIGNYFEEQTILNLAHAYESKIDWRQNEFKN